MCWWSFKMMKLHLIYVTLWSVAQAAYLSRMAIMNNPNSPIVGPNVGPNLNQHVRIRSSAFRPGVMMRPWTNPRFVQAASHRTPYVVYRNNQSPHRYAIKNYGPSRLIVWKGRPQGATPAEYEFVRAVTAAPKPRDGGAIHTIPAPNLSLAEKPIVVADDAGSGFTSETPKITYEVTEKFQDPAQMPAKIEQPIGFSKTTSFSFTPSELHSIVRNGATLQFPNELGISPLGLPHSAFSQSTLPPLPMVSSQSNILPHNIVAQPFLPQEFRVSSPNDMIQAGPGGIVISPDALYQPDPDFLQKLQNQLLQRFPGVEFVPYPADVHGPVQPQPQPQYPQQQSFSPQAPQQFQPQTQQPQPQQYPPQPQQYPPQPQQYPPQPQQHPPQPQPQQSQSQHSQPHQPPQLQPQIQPQSQPTLQQLQPQAQLPFFLLQNEQYTRPPSYLIEPQKSIVQRETQEGTVTLIPQVTTSNATEKRTESTSTTPQNLQNVTFELVAAESRPETTTIQYVVETTTGHQTTSPVYMQFAPVPQHVSSHQAANQLLQKVVFLQNAQNSIQPIQKESEKLEKNNTKEVNQSVRTDGQYSAVNDIRAVVGIEEKEKPQQNPEKENTTTTSTSTSSTSTTTTTSSTTTLQPDVKPYFIPQPDQIKNQSVTELKPLPGVPFAKSPNSVNVAYTLLRSNEKETKVAKDGSVYAGQIVEASVSEDHDFNKQKANLLTRRAPVRLVGVADNKEASTSSVRGPEKTTVVKAKIPPKSKLTFDENGEPVLRIYASYVGNASQKETVTSKLANVKNMKEVARKQENVDNWRGNVKALAKPFEPNPNNQVTKFGLKLRSRSDDYVPLFDEYYEE